jgi:hypothetical protein
MREFAPNQFLFMGGIHALRRTEGIGSDSSLSKEQKQDWLHDAECAETLCHGLGLTFSELSIKRIKDCLSQDAQISFSGIKKSFEELDNRIIDEMEARKFFSIEPSKQELLTNDLFGKQVAEAFPSAEQDIKHAGKCLAFEEWTASVFHSMRVLEIGLSVLAKDVGITKIDYRNWESLIHEVETNIKTASGGDKVKEQFYSEAALQFRYFKNAWRNHVMHVRDTYDEQRAETIFGHVRECMVHLATKLKDDAP